jgi:hypothetical protein
MFMCRALFGFASVRKLAGQVERCRRPSDSLTKQTYSPQTQAPRRVGPLEVGFGQRHERQLVLDLPTDLNSARRDLGRLLLVASTR